MSNDQNQTILIPSPVVDSLSWWWSLVTNCRCPCTAPWRVHRWWSQVRNVWQTLASIVSKSTNFNSHLIHTLRSSIYTLRISWWIVMEYSLAITLLLPGDASNRNLRKLGWVETDLCRENQGTNIWTADMAVYDPAPPNSDHHQPPGSTDFPGAISLSPT